MTSGRQRTGAAVLRIQFTAEDLARTRPATRPDPMWEIVFSLHRLQTAQGRWAFADWLRDARTALAGTALGIAVRKLLIPVLPRAAYFPDFVTPHEANEGLDRALAAILDTPPARVRDEIGQLDRRVGAPNWAPRLAERQFREEFVGALRVHHEALIAPYSDRMQAGFESERALGTRALPDGGLTGLLSGLAPAVRWRPPVLEVEYAADPERRLGAPACCGLRLSSTVESVGRP
ncbi:hypothetical protein [Streptomyces coerulescens]|uniref:Transcriptional regulator n=1 Tax=Streptomyces coerulescens TaxID=29304 RepID=A0ABW0CV92_STRCD